ncbi:extended synaptotagmin-1 isoform X1 [Brienomyrus brachyistius]|uniref:extended synaptotagmin-1 isoform X1 n=1 Tax=Brienomyrus brachyistius TaxID=42636 RepID=UPI0020B18295|nr:extended synaptotagmin-1 isoform X1 [Brienomyrus brachyistius]
MPSEDDELHGSAQPAKGCRGADAVSGLCSFGKCLGALLPVYLAGYFGFSIFLVVLGLMLYIGWRNSRDGKESRLRSAMYAMEKEQDFIATTVLRDTRSLPAWVSYPDVEKVEWLNKILLQAWPFVGQYVEKLLMETIAPSIRASNSHLQTLSFSMVNLGVQPMRVIGVKAHTEHDKKQVLLDLYISYAGDVEINVEVKKYFCKAGVKGIQLHGKLRVILEPLIGDVPLVGAVTLFFIRRPTLDINWTGLTNLLDIPGLNSMSDTMIMDIIASYLVLPNRLTVPLVADLHIAQLQSPLPRGIVRVFVLEAQDLVSKDNYGIISGKSDPYVILRVGPQVFTSHHVENNLNPQWREMYEVIVHEVPGQELEVEVFDKDPDQDDFMGRFKIDLGLVKKAQLVDEWFTLKDTASGRVHLKLEWLSLQANADRLEQILQRNGNITLLNKSSDPPSAAILTVYLDRAQELPMKKGNKEPNPMVQVSVQDTTKESRTCYGTNNPQWQEAFTFFIQDPRKQDIDIQVKDDDKAASLGTLSVPLSRLLSSAELTMNQWFQLDRSGPVSRIYIKAVLRVLLPNENASPSTLDSAVTDDLHGGNVGTGVDVHSRPLKTSPDSSFATEGVLRIHLVEAQDLIAKDCFMGGMIKGKSDPYVKTRVGGSTFQSRVVQENLNPTWNELYEVILTQLPGQDVQFEVYDKDLDRDDFLGRLKISLSDVISSHHIDQWFTLSEVKSGRIHLVLEWLPRLSDPGCLDQVLRYQTQHSYQNRVVPSAALLFIYLEAAHSLPLKKSGKEPKVGAELCLRGASCRTKVCDRAVSPRWDEAFHFLVHDPREDTLIIKLSHAWGLPLGSLVLPVRELLSEPGLELDRWLPVDGALPASQVLLRATLKILGSTAVDCSRIQAEDGGSQGDGNTEPIISSKETAAAPASEMRQRVTPGRRAAELEGSQVKLTLRYSVEENRLLVVVLACRHLPSSTKDAPDSCVSFILLPDKSKTTKRKTSVKKRETNPEFNERFDFELSLEEAKSRRLDLEVKNSTTFMSREREVIGRVQIDLARIDLKSGVTQWYNLTEVPN